MRCDKVILGEMRSITQVSFYNVRMCRGVEVCNICCTHMPTRISLQYMFHAYGYTHLGVSSRGMQLPTRNGLTVPSAPSPCLPSYMYLFIRSFVRSFFLSFVRSFLGEDGLIKANPKAQSWSDPVNGVPKETDYIEVVYSAKVSREGCGRVLS